MGIIVSKVIFWFCLGLFVYTYLGYPVFARVLARRRRNDRVTGQWVEPRVTVIVAAYNESAVIADRLTNIAEMDFPATKVEVIVASDGSTDRTNEIVSTWPDPRVRLLALPRGGKALAHNRAVAVATGDILVFTDTHTTFQKDFLAKIVHPFSRPEVGCVVGRLRYITERQTFARDLDIYWNYETQLRGWESHAGLLAVGSGACMAVRRGLFEELHPDEDGDDAIPLDLLLHGYRVVFASEAVAFDVAPSTPRDEIRARARMTVLSLTAILRRKVLLNPFRFPRAAVALLSHRVLRVLTPIFALGGFGSSVLLASEPLYRVAFIVQVLFYACALSGWVSARWGYRLPFVHSQLSFCVWNIGFGAGLVGVLRGQRVTTFSPQSKKGSYERRHDRLGDLHKNLE